MRTIAQWTWGYTQLMTNERLQYGDIPLDFRRRQDSGSVLPRKRLQKDLPSTMPTHAESNACSACARSKRKCSRQMPSCARCADRGRSCVRRTWLIAASLSPVFSALQQRRSACPGGIMYTNRSGFWNTASATEWEKQSHKLRLLKSLLGFKPLYAQVRKRE